MTGTGYVVVDMKRGFYLGESVTSHLRSPSAPAKLTWMNRDKALVFSTEEEAAAARNPVVARMSERQSFWIRVVPA